MKRRRLSFLSGAPRFQTRAERARGARSSVNRFRPAKCLGEQETTCRKRMKFTGSDNEDSSSLTDGVCCNKKIETTARRSGQPKTAEYAFFQKLKDDGTRRFQSHLPNVDRNQTEMFESQEDRRESYSVSCGSDKECSPSMFIENDIARKLNAFDTPVDTILKKSAIDVAHAPTASPNIFVKQKIEEPCSSPEMTGFYGTSDVFSRNKENLLCWLRRIMSPEIEELSSKRCNFLLSSKIDEDYIYKAPTTHQIRAANMKDKPMDFHSDINLTEFHQKPPKEVVEYEDGPVWGSGLSSTWPSKSTDRILSVYDSLTAHGTIPLSEPKRLACPSWEIVPYAKSDSALGIFPIEEDITAPFSYESNVEDLCLPLERNFNGDERNLLEICPSEDVINEHSAQSLDLWDSDQNLSIMGRFGTRRLPALPLDDNSGYGKHFNEDWIHDHLSEFSYLRAGDYGQYQQLRMEDSAPRSGFGKDPRLKFLLPWDSPSETGLFLERALRFPREEKFISMSILGKGNGSGKVSMDGLFQRESYGDFDRSYLYFHSSFQSDAFDHLL